jgi:hypothetical protein
MSPEKNRSRTPVSNSHSSTTHSPQSTGAQPASFSNITSIINSITQLYVRARRNATDLHAEVAGGDWDDWEDGLRLRLSIAATEDSLLEAIDALRTARSEFALFLSLHAPSPKSKRKNKRRAKR